MAMTASARNPPPIHAIADKRYGVSQVTAMTAAHPIRIANSRATPTMADATSPPTASRLARSRSYAANSTYAPRCRRSAGAAFGNDHSTRMGLWPLGAARDQYADDGAHERRETDRGPRALPDI